MRVLKNHSRIQFPNMMEVYGFAILMHTLTGGDGF